MADITDITQHADSTPEEAAKHIERATVFGIEAPDYRNMKQELDPEYERLQKPTDASETTKEYMQQSPEHTALASQDSEHLSMIDATSKYIGDIIFNRPTPGQRLNELSLKKMQDPTTFSEEDELAIWELNQQMTKESKDRAAEPPSLPEQVAESILEMGRGARRHAPMIAGFTGAGALVGLATPVPGGTVGGAAAGFGYGITAFFMKDTYDQMAGGMYNELSNLTKPDGTLMNIDENTKANIARGTGIISGALMGVVGHTLTKTTPWLNKFVSPSMAVKLMMNPGNAAILKTVMNIGQASVVGGGASGAVEMVRIVAEEMGNSYDGTEASFLNALQAAGQKLEENAKRVGGAALVGAATGAAISTVTGVAGFGRTKAMMEQRSAEAMAKMRARVENTRDVTPEAAKQIEARAGTPEGGPEVGPMPGVDPVQKKLDVFRPEAPPVEPIQIPIQQASKSVNFREALQNISKFARQTKMKELSPSELSKFLQLSAARAGIKKVWVNLQDFRDSHMTPEDLAEAKRVMGIDEEVINASVAVDPDKVIQFDHDHPDAKVLDHIRPEGDLPSGAQAENWIKTQVEAEERRAQVLYAMGITPKEMKAAETEAALPENVTKLQTAPAAPSTFDPIETIRRTTELLKEKQKLDEQYGGPSAPFTKEEALELYTKLNKLETEQKISKDAPGTKGYEPGEFTRRAVEILDARKPLVGHFTDAKYNHLKDQPTFEDMAAYFELTQHLQNPGINDLDRKRQQNELKKLEEKLGFYKEGEPHKGRDRHARKVEKINAELESLKKQTMQHYAEQPNATVLKADWTAPYAEKKSESLAQDLLNSPEYTQFLESIVPKAERERFTKASKKAKADYIKGAKQAAELQMLKVQDIEVQHARQLRIEAERARIANDPDIAKVEQFHRDVVANSKGRSKVSIYAIDPKTLTDDQVAYLTERGGYRLDRLKMSGVLKGNQTAEQAADMIGVKDGDDFLRIMSETPRRQELIEARAGAYFVSDAQKALDNVKLDHANIIQALTNESEIAYEWIQFMKNKEWPALKGGIKRVALNTAKIPEIRNRAEMAIKQTKVGDLNYRPYLAGQRQSLRQAVTHFLNGRPYEAFVAKEAEIHNIEMQRASLIMIGNTNRAKKWLKQYTENENNFKHLKDAGGFRLEAAIELIDSFGLAPSKKGEAKVGSFLKWARLEKEAGRGEFAISDGHSEIKQSIDEMTSEAFLAVVDMLKVIDHSAKDANKLYNAKIAAEKAQTKSEVRAEIHEITTQNSDYNLKRLPPVQDHTMTEGQYYLNKMRSTKAAITNLEFIVKHLDIDKYAGRMHTRFVAPVKGDGRFYGKRGYTKEHLMTTDMNEWFDKEIERYGKYDYERLNSKILNIQEFAKSPELNYGRLTKGDLISLWMYGGDPLGKVKRVENHGVTEEQIQTVLDRELQERDVNFGQAIVDRFKIYQKETYDLQKRVTGQDVHFVKGVPNVWNGKEYAGGYVPNQHKIDYTVETANKVLDDIKQQKSEFFQGKEWDGRHYAMEQTEQNRLIEREGSDKPLDLSLLRKLRAHEEIIHDLSYRETIIDGLKLLRDPEIRQDIIAVVGHKDYGVMVNTYIELANRIEAQNQNYFADPSRMIKDLQGTVTGRLSVAILAYNPSSVIIQTASFGQMLINLGPKSPIAAASVLKNLAENVHLFWGFYQAANEMDPTIGHFLESLQNKVISNVVKRAPGDKKSGVRGIWDATLQMTTDVGMTGMALADTVIKVSGALVAHEHFIMGHTENYPSERLAKMTPQERNQAAQEFVGQISRTSFTHARDEDKALAQKNPVGSLVTPFWNDARNKLNTYLALSRKIRRAYRAGDYKEVAGLVAGMILVSSVTRILQDELHKRETILDVPLNGQTPSDAAWSAYRVGRYFAMSPFADFVESTPIVRSVDYGASVGRSKSKKAGELVNNAYNNAATTWNYLQDLTEGLSEGKVIKPNKAQVTSLFYMASLATKSGIAINGPIKWAKIIGKTEAYKDLVQDDGDVEKLKKEVNAFRTNPPPGVHEDFMDDVIKLDDFLKPKDGG